MQTHSFPIIAPPVPVGAIVGGVVGGTILICLIIAGVIILAVVCSRKQEYTTNETATETKP